MGRTSALHAPPRPARPPRARGVEAYSKRVGTGAATIGYPLYDAHGNNVATLTKGGGTWSIGGTLRAYDAWGNVAGALGDPSGRYCANLGHVQDDESGLVYMRARYYEPGSGRFISEDPAMDGLNWFAYCGGDPVNYADQSGKERVWLVVGDFELSFDWYCPKGSSESIPDIHWRKLGDKLKDGRGSVRIDGIIKHGDDFPGELKGLLSGSNAPGAKKYRKLGGAVDSIRASFNADPLGTLDIIALALFGRELFGGDFGW